MRTGTDQNRIDRRRATRKERVWDMGLVSDHTADRRPLRVLVVLVELTAIAGAPAHPRSVRHAKLFSAEVQRRCWESDMGTRYINSGSPWQNGMVGSRNERPRNELQSSVTFATLAEPRLLVDGWRLHRNHRRMLRVPGTGRPRSSPAMCRALPPLQLTILACAAAAPRTQGRARKGPLPCTRAHDGRALVATSSWTLHQAKNSLCRSVPASAKRQME